MFKFDADFAGLSLGINELEDHFTGCLHRPDAQQTAAGSRDVRRGSDSERHVVGCLSSKAGSTSQLKL